MKTLKTIILSLAALAAVSCGAGGDCCSVKDGRFVQNGSPLYYIGANVWYAPTLATTDPGRLCRELDYLKSLGVTNLRILATDENWEGYDIALNELQKRGMQAVMYLNNAWEWTPDAYFSYLEKAGAGKQPHPAVEGYTAYMSAMAQFACNPDAVALFHEHVKKMVGRYKGNGAIFSWQICNEPRPFSSDPAVKNAYADYICKTAELIKSIDSAHMVSTGNEGTAGCENDLDLFEKIHSSPAIDYCTIHIWPYNWGWVSEGGIEEGVKEAIAKTDEYIDTHLEVAYKLRKPLVIEEFGYPRDGFEYVNTSSTLARNAYYDHVFGRVAESARTGGWLAGCNFWTWSGEAKQTPGHQFWQEGDDLCGDPSQEAQGLNGVYISDNQTIEIIRKHTAAINSGATVWAPIEHDWIFSGFDPHKLRICASSIDGCETDISIALVRDLSLMFGRDTVLTDTRHASIEPGKTVTLTYELGNLEPGFYEVCLSSGQSFNIGIEPTSIVSPQDKPADFDAFWDQTLTELAAVPMEATITAIPEASNELRRSFRVEYKSLGGVTVGGILCQPVKPGKYRTYIDYMGYGADPYNYDPSANPEAVEFLVSVRDQGIFKAPDAVRDWMERGLQSKEDNYYRGAFCDVIRAIDFICSLGTVDKEHIFARGESQGGAFTWISASLDHRVAAIAPAVPFLSDYPDYEKIVWWPMWEVMEAADAQGIDRNAVRDMLRYFDVKNFTDKITCPVLMAFGLQDPTCPPHTNFAGYNLVKSSKSFYCVPTCEHAMWRETSWPAKREEFFSRY